MQKVVDANSPSHWIHRRPRTWGGRPPTARSTLPLRSCAVSGAKQPTSCCHHHCLTRRDTRGTEKPTAQVSVIAANARAARYSPFPIASTQATPPAMTAKSESSDAAHRDGMEIRVPSCHAAPRTIRSPKSAALPAPCHFPCHPVPFGAIEGLGGSRSACRSDRAAPDDPRREKVMVRLALDPTPRRSS